MRFWDWLKVLRFSKRRRRKVVATLDDHGASCRWPDGTIESVAWDDVRAIEIRTTDDGPFVEDVFLVLHAEAGGCIVPQEAEGFEEILTHVGRWPGFDYGPVVKAMSCADNAIFPCWRRPDA